MKRKLLLGSAMPLKDAQPFFESLALPGNRQAIAEKILREIEAGRATQADLDTLCKFPRWL